MIIWWVKTLIGTNMEKFLFISAGAIRANARYWLGDWAAQKWGASFPIGTMIFNLTGSLLLGFFITLATERFMLDPRWRLLVAVGFLRLILLSQPSLTRAST